MPSDEHDNLVAECWQDLVEKTDRTSPGEYPEMALITREELADYMNATLLAQRDAADRAGRERIMKLVLDACDAEIAEWETNMGSSSILQRHAMRCLKKRIELLAPAASEEGSER